MSNPHVKTFYVLRHAYQASYLKSLSGTFTEDRDQAFRAATPEEAETFKAAVKVPLAWKVVPVNYDTTQGKVID